ncbi:MAG TPA: carbon storage regulator [Acidiferrobacterales bacterium]|nr:carbon storage regulator [Acidiferrobacterales bacterium]
MLILTRKPGQCIHIGPHESLDLTTPVGELFREGPIAVMVTHIEGGQVKLGIQAHRGFLILRDDAAGRARYPLDDAWEKCDV